MIEAQLLSGLMLFMLKVLYKGVDEVIDAGYKEGAEKLHRLLYGDEAKQQVKNLEKIIARVANDERWEKEIKSLITHIPFQEEIICALLDVENVFNFDHIIKTFQERFPNKENLQKNINRFFNALRNELMFDPYWGQVVNGFQDIYSDPKVNTILTENEKLNEVRQLVEMIQKSLEPAPQTVELLIEHFYGTYVKADRYIEQTIYLTTEDFASQRKQRAIDEAYEQYLIGLRNQCFSLPLTVMGDDGRFSTVHLDDVYISLYTTTEIPLKEYEDFFMESFEQGGLKISKLYTPNYDIGIERIIQVSAFDAFRKYPHMVLLGEPGSGKSSFVKYLLGRYTEAILENTEQLLGFKEGLFPLFVNLREISNQLIQDTKGALTDCEKETRYLNVIKNHCMEMVFGEDRKILKNKLNKHWAKEDLFLVLDGLDEVPENHRFVVRNTILAIQKHINPNRMIVTCRTRSYSEKIHLKGFTTFCLKSLSRDQILGFIQKWYKFQYTLGKLTKTTVEERIKDLSEAAFKDSLIELSENPMLITTMIIIHQRDTRLPEQRVELYKHAVELLLRKWQKYEKGKFNPSKDLEVFLNDSQKLYALVEQFAYEAHMARKGVLTQENTLVILLNEAFPKNWNLAREFLDYVDQRSGLLIGYGGEEGKYNSYGFPHRTFQEYLAACYLVGQRNYEQLLFEKAGEGDYWRFVVQLSFEELKHNRRIEDKLSRTAYYLCPKGVRGGEVHQRAALWAGLIVEKLGVEYIKKDIYSPYGGELFLEELRNTLVDYLGKKMTPKEWVEAGNILAEIDDPRFYGEELFCLPKDENLGFVEVPGGKFWMGEVNNLHQVYLPTYHLCKMMVTVEQFLLFTKVTNYKEFDFSRPKVKPNQPVRWVTWQSTIRYCEWLQHELINSMHTPNWIRENLFQGWRIILPSEAEWEKAAKGFTNNKYPWGDEIKPENANYWKNQIGGPSAVGCFPKHGLNEKFYDLSGNLWEWTRSIFKEYPYQIDERESLHGKNDRVLRGGNFNGSEINLRCSSRSWFDPLAKYDFIGFRLALIPPIDPKSSE